MGGATFVPISTFSSYTLWGTIDLDQNCLIALLFFPLYLGATRCHLCRKRPILSAEINQERQHPRQGQVQDMENADALFVTAIPSVTVAEEVMQDQRMVADDHITIVSSAYV